MTQTCPSIFTKRLGTVVIVSILIQHQLEHLTPQLLLALSVQTSVKNKQMEDCFLLWDVLQADKDSETEGSCVTSLSEAHAALKHAFCLRSCDKEEPAAENDPSLEQGRRFQL